MHDDPRIHRRVDEIVGGCGLPEERRREVAEELRCHLGQSVASRCAAGMSEDEAITSALAAFGPSTRLRRQLRGRRRRLDAGQVSRKMLRLAWAPALYAGMLALLPAVVAAATGAQSFHLGEVAAIFMLQFLAVTAFMFGGEMCNIELERGVPIEQHRFVLRLTHWMLMVTGGLVCLLLLAMATFAGCGSSILAIGSGRPAPAFAGISPWRLCCNFSMAWWQAPTSSLILCTVAIIGSGIGLTLYERRRCVKE